MPCTAAKEELLAILGGTALVSATQKISFLGVEYDSREIKGGELFIALRGEKSHGHEFVPTALARGAALCLVEDRAVEFPKQESERIIVVPDTLRAFSMLATWWRKETGVRLGVVTGSVGKTTVKEMAATILLQGSVGSYSLKSHNNHVGVPYSICRIGREHRWAVVELGMNHAGEIANLTRIARPDIAAITKIAPAHLENFKDIHGIADAKCEIVDGLVDGAPLVVNGDDEVLRGGLERRRADARFTLRRFGSAPASECRVSDLVSRGLDGISFTLTLHGTSTPMQMSALGRPSAMNAAAAALLAVALDPTLTAEQIRVGLASFRAPLMRLNIMTLSDGRKIIDDSYNANPASLRGALDLLAELQEGGSSVGAVLGDMLELGSRSAEFHGEIGVLVGKLKPQFLVTVGEFSRGYEEPAKSLGVPVFHADSAEAAAHLVAKFPAEVVLIKGSRGIGLDRTVKVIVERYGAR